MMAPMAMAVGGRAGIPPFLMAIMVGNGAQAGALSPFAPTGIIVTGLMTKIDLGGHELRTYLANLIAHAIVAFGGYFLFGGWRLFRMLATRGAAEEVAGTVEFTGQHGMTLAVIGCVLIAVLFLNANIGMAAFTGAVVLSLLRLADHDQAIRKMPWTPILMVCGMSVLVALLEKTKGLDLFTALAGVDLDARHAHRRRRAGDRPRLGLQQHVGRRAARVPAYRARPDRAPRWRRVRRRDVDERRRAPRGHVAALDDRRDVHRRDCGPHAGTPDLQQAACVGPFDDGHRGGGVLAVLLKALGSGLWALGMAV